MLDIKFIRENAEKVKQGAKDKGVDVDIDKLLYCDKKRRELIAESESLKAKQNKINIFPGATKHKDGPISLPIDSVAFQKTMDPVAFQQAIELKAKFKELEARLEPVEKEYQ